MIKQTHAEIKIASSNSSYWKSRGYHIEPLKRGNKDSQFLTVRIEDLQSNSNVYVLCNCDDCGKEYTQRFCRDKDVCKSCNQSKKSLGNTSGKALKGRKIPSMTGELHPRWNPNKSAMKAYYSKVRKLTEENYVRDIDLINPLRLPRTLCGVDGGYQLDHRISVKKGFMFGINPKVIASTDNLQMLTWPDNRLKAA